MQQKSLAKNAFFNIIYKLTNVIFPIITTAYASRVLLPEGVGKVAYAQNLVSYFVLLAALGIPSYGVREIARCRESGTERNQVFSELFFMNLVSSLLCIVGYLIFVFYNPALQEERLLHLSVVLLLIFNLFNVDWLYQGLESYGYIAIRSTLVKLGSVLMILLFVHTQTDYIRYAVINCLAVGGNNLFNIYHSRKYVSLTWKNLHFYHHFRPILFLLVCVVSTELYSKVDITMLGSGYGDAVVGYYSNAQRMINTVVTSSIALTAVFLPRLSSYFKEDRKKYNELVQQGLEILQFLIFPAAVGTFLVTPQIVLVLFGERFLPAVPTMRILCLLIVIKCFGDLLCYQVIISSGNERYFTLSYIGAALLNILLNSMLIPRWLQNGAAAASVASELFLNGTLLFVSLKIIHFSPRRRQFLSCALGTVCMAITVRFCGVLPLSPFFSLVLSVMVGGTVYVVATYFLKNSIMRTAVTYLRTAVQKHL